MQWHNTPTNRLICLHFQRPEEAETPCPGPSVHRNLLPNETRWQTHLEPSRAPNSERYTEIFDGLKGVSFLSARTTGYKWAINM